MGDNLVNGDRHDLLLSIQRLVARSSPAPQRRRETRIDDVAAVGSNPLRCMFPPRPWRHFQSPDLQQPALAQSHGLSAPSLVLPLLVVTALTPSLQRSASANGSSGLRLSQSRSLDTVVATGHRCLYPCRTARQCQLLIYVQPKGQSRLGVCWRCFLPELSLACRTPRRQSEIAHLSCHLEISTLTESHD